MMLELVEAGLATMVQGTPYRGLRHLGMPLAGAADPLAMALANWLVGNSSETAALETAYVPTSLIARASCTVAVQGAAGEVEIDGRSLETGQALYLDSGQMLKIPSPKGGCRSYLAIGGGINVPVILGATSTYTPARLGGIDGAVLKRGALVKAEKATAFQCRDLPARYRLRHGMDFLLRIVCSSETEWISVDSLLGQSWTISRRANRIGMELEGEPLSLLCSDQLDSSAVFPGTIQCPPSGLPFLLGADAQTTGGYPRIAQVIRADRHLIGQLRPGARVRFKRIEPAEAQRIYWSKIALMRQLQPDFRLD